MRSKREHDKRAAAQSRLHSSSDLKKKMDNKPLLYKRDEEAFAGAHGDRYPDPYHWTCDRKNPQVKRFLKQENEQVNAFFRDHAPWLQKKLFTEMRRRWKEEDNSLPTLDRNYWYYMRQVVNAEHPILCRRPYSEEKNINVHFIDEVVAFWAQHPPSQSAGGSVPSLPHYEDETILLDLNLLQQQLKLPFVDLGDVEVSPDEDHLAVMVDCSNGKEIFSLFILQIASIDYAHWRLHESSPMERAWAQHLADTNASPYTPVSPASFLSSPTSSPSPTTQKQSSLRPSPASPAQTSSSFPSKPPQHHILRQIDLYDMSGEVQWVSDHALLYLGMDEKMRPYQLIYHYLWPAGCPAACTSDLNVSNLIASSGEDAEETIVCYEETNESFWLGGLTFTADEKYWMCNSSSVDVSEYMVGLTGALHPAGTDGAASPPFRRCINGVPRFCPSDDAWINEKNASLKLREAPITEISRFAARAPTALEYELDHHSDLLGPDRGGWLISTNAFDCANFALYYLEDEAVARVLPGEALSDTRQWTPLFSYDASIRVENVECLRTFLLINVRRDGAPTVLFCPLEWIHEHFAKREGCGGDSQIFLEPLKMSLLFDMAGLVDIRLAHLPTQAGAIGPHTTRTTLLSPYAFPSLTQNTPVEASLHKTQSFLKVYQAKTNESEAPMDELVITHLPTLVECYSFTSSFTSKRGRLVVSHLLHPTAVYEWAWSAAEKEIATRLLKREVVQGEVEYRADDYDGAVVWVPSAWAFEGHDEHPPTATPIPTKDASPAVLIPVSLCWRRELFKIGCSPMWLTTYGSYGDCSDADFASERLSLLDRGIVWAQAAVRGGGELGIPWRDAGRKLQRGTCVNDFLSVSAYLVDCGFCRREKGLLATGGSAGGMVVTRAALQAPHLYHALLGVVPFVDCLTTLMDDSLPLTVTEWGEYGNPVEDRDAYDLIKAWSPLNAVPPTHPAGGFPNTLMETTWDDTRVGYWEAMKLIAAMRAVTADSDVPSETVEGRGLLLHWCDFGSGHCGATGRYQQLKETAREYAFACIILGASFEAC